MAVEILNLTQNQLIGIFIIIINVIPLILKKFKLISLTALLSVLIIGLSLGGLI